MTLFNAPSGLMRTACTASVEGREIAAVSSLGSLGACVEHVDGLIEHANERCVSTVLSAHDRQAKMEQRLIDESDQRLQDAREELEGL
jgi:hypothetical protein